LTENKEVRFLFMFADADIYKPGAQMKDTHSLTMFVIGDPKQAEVFSWFVKHMEPQHDTTETIKLTEFHLGSQGIAERSKLIPLNTIRTAKQEFYPAIDNNIYQLYDRFMASPSNIWLLVGPRGTGKTTFIRTLAAHSGCPAHICSDTTTMCHPSGVQHISQLANDDKKNLIVVEDAGEEFLGPRTEGNQTMASILNIFEGVLPTSGKLIITTNVIDVNKMDPALLRPGRLFATTWFGYLNHKQANKILRSVGKKPITEKKYIEVKAEQKEGVTLAQILNLETQDLVRAQRKFGFLA
jgi:SpoVK/Ycf46/Vps4 family AAA+-type ATPase